MKPMSNPSLYQPFMVPVTARRQSPECSASMAFKLPQPVPEPLQIIGRMMDAHSSLAP